MSNREEDKKKRQREEDDEVCQEDLDDDLLAACKSGSLDDVERALGSGGSINATNAKGKTGLLLACERDDWEEAENIVKFLLAKRFAPGLGDNDGQNSVHVAAVCSSAQVVKMLLDKCPTLVDLKNRDGYTPLGQLCCTRTDEESALVAAVLLDRGANMETKKYGGKDRTCFLLACRSGRAEVVSLLLERGANVKAVDLDKSTALNLACANGAFGRDIIPVLVEAGFDVEAKDGVGDRPLEVALNTNSAMGEALLPFLPLDSKPNGVIISNSDPVGSFAMCQKLGVAMRSFWSSDIDHLCSRYRDESIWSHLRNGLPLKLDDSEDDVFNALERCDRVRLWIYASREPCFQQHPLTGDTVLHLLCRTEKLSLYQKLDVLDELKRDFRNPLIPNFKGERAIDLACASALKREIARYMEFQGNRWVMHWYGPAFRKRAFALLLVMKRLGVNANKEERELLIRYLTKVEFIYANQ